MTVESVLLFIITSLLMISLLVSDNSVRATFQSSAPSLGARMERQIQTGTGFFRQARSSQRTSWQLPRERERILR